jgi:tRNA pseudouridine38-40 synthase
MTKFSQNVYRLTLEYDGTRYHGWQEQPNARTVAGEVRAAISALADENVELAGAGRTDAGVHALAQVAHFHTKAKLKPGMDLLHAINARLPPDINALRIESAAPDFHARHDAIARYYLYQIATRRTAFAKRYVWWVRDRLDIALMRRGAETFRGMHDFSAFSQKDDGDSGRKRGAFSAPSRRADVHLIQLETLPGMILIRIGASHFLWKMVRRIVGSLVAVGAGKLSQEFLHTALHSQRPNDEIAALTAPPSGLFFERAEYPGEIAAPARGRPRLGLPRET